MGVELGKVLAKNILAQLEKPEDVKGHDSSVSLLKYNYTRSYTNMVPPRLLASSTIIRSSGKSEETECTLCCAREVIFNGRKKTNCRLMVCNVQPQV